MNKMLLCCIPNDNEIDNVNLLDYDQLKQRIRHTKLEIENTPPYIFFARIYTNLKERFNPSPLEEIVIEEPEVIELETIHMIIDSVVDEMKASILSIKKPYIEIRDIPPIIKELQVNVNKQIIEKYTQTYGIDGADDYINIEIDPDFNYVDIQ